MDKHYDKSDYYAVAKVECNINEHSTLYPHFNLNAELKLIKNDKDKIVWCFASNGIQLPNLRMKGEWLAENFEYSGAYIKDYSKDIFYKYNKRTQSSESVDFIKSYTIVVEKKRSAEKIFKIDSFRKSDGCLAVLFFWSILVVSFFTLFLQPFFH